MSIWKFFLGFDPNRQRSFPGQQPGEEIELMTVHHWINLVPFCLQICTAGIILMGLNNFTEFFFRLDPFTRLAINTITTSFLIHWFFMKLYNHYLKVIIITNYRLMDVRNTIFFQRDRESIPMTNIQDFRCQQRGIISRFLKYGDLIIIGSNSDIKYKLYNIPNVNRVHHLLSGLHQIMLTQQRSIHKPVDSRIIEVLPEPHESY